MSETIEVDYNGPIFDGRAGMIIDQAARDMEHHLASVGADFVRAELERVLRKETPYYRLQVTSREYPGRTVITDGGVVYGPWLEGTGSRNRTHPLQGLRHVPAHVYRIQSEAVNILRPNVDRLVAELNGA
jgi:hypothetical protein